MPLSAAQIDAISRQVYGQFPELRGSRPVVQAQAVAKTAGGSGRFVLVFKGDGRGPGGQAIPRIVRVVADERGRVVKISTSR
jgi:hypothetical protein